MWKAVEAKVGKARVAETERKEMGRKRGKTKEEKEKTKERTYDRSEESSRRIENIR